MIETNSACWSCLSAADLVNLIDSICFGFKYSLSHVDVVLKKFSYMFLRLAASLLSGTASLFFRS